MVARLLPHRSPVTGRTEVRDWLVFLGAVALGLSVVAAFLIYLALVMGVPVGVACNQARTVLFAIGVYLFAVWLGRLYAVYATARGREKRRRSIEALGRTVDLLTGVYFAYASMPIVAALSTSC
jgi:membrane-bound ClpP family serine protease